MWAQEVSNKELIKNGNKYYLNNEFEKAINEYEKVIKSGYESPDLYYNLANAYYRQKNNVMAIVNYERAKLHSPYNEAINHNLDIANRIVQDKIEKLPQFFISEWLSTLIVSYKSKTWAIISIFSFFLCLTLALLFFFSKVSVIKKIAFWTGILFFTLSISTYIFSYNQKQKLTKHNMAIISEKAITVKSSPNENGTELFIIHEGLKVEITDNSDAWLEIKLIDGKVGWLPVASIVRI